MKKGEYMRINITEVEDARVFDYLVAPEQNPINQAYLEQNFRGNAEILTDMGRSFVQRSRQLFEQANHSNLAQQARAIMRRVKTFFNPNSIMELNTLEAIRCAQPVMQRYIMAEPHLRKEYHAQRIDGYSDSYVDMSPKQVGDDHYDYRRVMQGVMVECEEHGWYSKTYSDDIFDEDRELDLFEQDAILTTWEIARSMLYNKDDPTDIYG